MFERSLLITDDVIRWKYLEIFKNEGSQRFQDLLCKNSVKLRGILTNNMLFRKFRQLSPNFVYYDVVKGEFLKFCNTKFKNVICGSSIPNVPIFVDF